MTPPNMQQMIMNMAKSHMGNNPILKNAIQMAEKGDSAGLENLARNLCKENNIDVDKAVSQVKSQFGIK